MYARPVLTLLLLFVSGTTLNLAFAQMLPGLDGTVTEKERTTYLLLSENAGHQLLADNSDKKYLRIAVTGDRLHVASICLTTDGESVQVLHASAALGGLLLNKEGDDFRTSGAFTWELRNTAMDKAAMSERNEYLERNGWVATTMGMGEAGNVEFIIRKDQFKGNKIYLAAGLMTASDPSGIVALPREEGGHCASHSLVSGAPDPFYPMQPSGWLVINPE